MENRPEHQMLPTALCATRVGRQSAVLKRGNPPSPDCWPCKN